MSLARYLISAAHDVVHLCMTIGIRLIHVYDEYIRINDRPVTSFSFLRFFCPSYLSFSSKYNNASDTSVVATHSFFIAIPILGVQRGSY